jgi:hypothetical protein
MMVSHDLRYALRLTRRDWRFSATLVATLADGGVLPADPQGYPDIAGRRDEE